MGMLGTLIPLVILAVFVSGFAYVAYAMYLYTHDMADRGRKSMEKRNISFSKDGMKVKVKHVSNEDLEDKTQSMFVKTWNLGNESKGSPKPDSRSSSTSAKKMS